MQSSVAAIRRGRLQAHFVTSHGHHRTRRFGLTEPTRGRIVPAARPTRHAGSRALGLGHLRRGERMTWTSPASPARRDGVTPTAAWRD